MAFIDRSNVNPHDWSYKGFSGIYLKATEGTGFVDSTRAARAVQAHDQGVKLVGYYHFADLADPVAECDHFLSVIGRPIPGQLRPCLDLERGAVVTDVAWAEKWITRFKAERGYLPALYGSTSLIAPLRQASKLIASCPWWRAEYGVNDGALHSLAGGTLGAAAHQYTSVARYPGINGLTDASVFLNEAAMLIPQPPAPAPKPTPGMPKSSIWAWAMWYLGVGPYAGRGRWAAQQHQSDALPQPQHGPATRIARWAAVKWLQRHNAK